MVDNDDLAHTLALVAQNDGEAYRAHDARRAVDAAFKDYQRRMREAEREAFREIRPRLVRELFTRWKATWADEND